MSQADREGNCIQRVASSVTSVVDVADMAVLSERNGSGQALVAVCGIGLELLQTSSLP